MEAIHSVAIMLSSDEKYCYSSLENLVFDSEYDYFCKSTEKIEKKKELSTMESAKKKIFSLNPFK